MSKDLTTKILVVDDEEVVRQSLTRLLTSRGYESTGVGDLASARRVLASTQISLVLCDIQMPGESGLDLLRDIATELPNTATVMVTGVDDSEVAREAIALGAYGYVVKPFRPNEILINVMHALRRLELEKETRGHAAELESKLTERSWSLNQAISKLRDHEGTEDLPLQETMERLGRALSLRDEETGRHIERVGRFCELLSEKCGVDAWPPKTIRMASMLHDVGKLGVPDAILRKPSALTEAERRIVERHCELGYQLLIGSRSPVLTLSATIALTHHERWDGAGYPHRLRGEKIPLEGRITSLADVFDALTSNRVYRSAFSVDEAVAMMSKERGRQFDPQLFDVFLGAIDDFSRIREELPDEGRRLGPPIRVLVVDDHQLFADGMATLLGTEEDITVVGQGNSIPEAIDLATQTRPDVVLLDWNLPGGTGADVTRSIRQQMPETKVVILTSETDGSVLTEALEAGCSGLLSKHGELEDTVEAVRAAYLGEVTIPLPRLSTVLARGSRTTPPTDLTKRELEILGLLAEGLSNAAIAEQLFISVNTVRNHVQRILEKLGVHSKLEAVTTSLRSGVVEVPVNR